jgi:hypothetical protein
MLFEEKNQQAAAAQARLEREERERKIAEEKAAKQELELQNLADEQARIEQERQRIAAEQARLDEERTQAAAEKARLEELEHKAAEEKSKQAEAERQAIAAEQARLDLERQRLVAEQARLDDDRKQVAAEKTRLEQLEQEQKAAEESARQEEESKQTAAQISRREHEDRERQRISVERVRMEVKQAEAERVRLDQTARARQPAAESANLETSVLWAENEIAPNEKSKLTHPLAYGLLVALGWAICIYFSFVIVFSYYYLRFGYSSSARNIGRIIGSLICFLVGAAITAGGAKLSALSSKWSGSVMFGCSLAYITAAFFLLMCFVPLNIKYVVLVPLVGSVVGLFAFIIPVFSRSFTALGLTRRKVILSTGVSWLAAHVVAGLLLSFSLRFARSFFYPGWDGPTIWFYLYEYRMWQMVVAVPYWLAMLLFGAFAGGGLFLVALWQVHKRGNLLDSK